MAQRKTYCIAAYNHTTGELKVADTTYRSKKAAIEVACYVNRLFIKKGNTDSIRVICKQTQKFMELLK